MIIAFIGLKQSGKSTAAKYLETKGFVRHNFKDALIKELKQNFPDLLEEIREDRQFSLWQITSKVGNRKQLNIDDLFEEKPPLVRKLLQNYGTEVRRKDDKDYWVIKWKESEVYKFRCDIVVDDVRFLNEAQAVKNTDGKIIKIIRTGQASNDNHVSETEHNQIKHDYTIEVGEGEQDKLYKQLDEIIDSLNK